MDDWCPKDAYWVTVHPNGTRTLVRGRAHHRDPSSIYKPVLACDGLWYEAARRPPLPGERRPILIKNEDGFRCVSVPSEFDLAAGDALDLADWEWLVEHGRGWAYFTEPVGTPMWWRSDP